MVRLGIGLHGIAALPKVQSKLAQVAILKSSISQIKQVKKGETVGYNRSGIASEDLKNSNGCYWLCGWIFKTAW